MCFNSKQQNHLVIIISVVLLISNLCNAQSSYLYRRASVLNGNNISIPFTNDGILGQPGNMGPLGVTWKGLHNGHLGDLSIVIGVEFPVKDYTGDGIPDTLHEVIITPVNRLGGGSSGPDGKVWGFEPG